MKPPENEKGQGAVTPQPQAATVKATALLPYAKRWPDDNGKVQWLAISRQQVEQLIEAAIDWLDLIDRLETQPQAGENGK